MREIRPYGSEGGGAGNRSPYPYWGMKCSGQQPGSIGGEAPPPAEIRLTIPDNLIT